MFGLGKKKEEKKKKPNFSVYIVDDEEDIREILSYMLEDTISFSFKEFSNVDDTIAALEEETVLPDLILSDVMMPGLSGFALSSILEEKGLEIPIIYITGLKGDDIHDGKHIVLSKPFSKSIIKGEVKKALKIAM